MDHNHFDRAVGARIRRFRKLRGLTQQQLAEMIGISFQQVQKYEHGANKISFERLHKLCEIFEVPLDAWLEGDAPRPAAPGNGDRQALSLLQSFHSITDEERRSLLCQVARALVA